MRASTQAQAHSTARHTHSHASLFEHQSAARLWLSVPRTSHDRQRRTCIQCIQNKHGTSTRRSAKNKINKNNMTIKIIAYYNFCGLIPGGCHAALRAPSISQRRHQHVVKSNVPRHTVRCLMISGACNLCWILRVAWVKVCARQTCVRMCDVVAACCCRRTTSAQVITLLLAYYQDGKRREWLSELMWLRSASFASCTCKANTGAIAIFLYTYRSYSSVMCLVCFILRWAVARENKPALCLHSCWAYEKCVFTHTDGELVGRSRAYEHLLGRSEGHDVQSLRCYLTALYSHLSGRSQQNFGENSGIEKAACYMMYGLSLIQTTWRRCSSCFAVVSMRRSKSCHTSRVQLSLCENEYVCCVEFEWN